MWARFSNLNWAIGDPIHVQFEIDEEQATLIMEAALGSDPAFEIVVKKTAEAIGDE